MVQGMTQVHTTEGLVDRALLSVKDITTEDDNSRAIATEWYLGDKMVRRDVAISMLRGVDVFGGQAAI